MEFKTLHYLNLCRLERDMIVADERGTLFMSASPSPKTQQDAYNRQQARTFDAKMRIHNE
jgi:hypothetical protein